MTMSDDELIRRRDALDAVRLCEFRWQAEDAIAALAAAPTFTAADLEAAFRVGLEMAASVQIRTWDDQVTHEVHPMVQHTIRALSPPADLADRVKSQGDEFAKQKRGVRGE